MLAGLAFSGLGSLTFALAQSVDWLFWGRAFMGIGVGLSAGPSAAAIVEFSPPHRVGQAGGATAAAQGLGMMSAALIGGPLIQYAPLPLRLNFAVLSGFLAGLFAMTWFMPNHTASRPSGRWKPKVPSIPNGAYAVFVTSTAAVTGSYVLGAMTLSLGAQVARDVVASSNALVNGGTIALFALASTLATIPARKIAVRIVMLSGGISAIVASAVLAIAAVEHSLSLYILAQLGAGAAYSWLLLGGLSLMNSHLPVTHRAATLSALFLVAYLAQALVALSLGKTATIYGLAMAVDIGVVTVAALALLTLLLDLIQRKTALGRSRKARS